ncbi:MAG TPA: tetratricopeptide repeat protein [Steroidobacteraceae bacterium]|nr:tetratricopeptide repeat protein [Steroidobacteraceae bacterium]
MLTDTKELLVAQEAHRAGRAEEAEQGYMRWLDAHPNEHNGLHFLGLLKFQTKRLQEGIDLVRRSLEFDATNAHAWNNLGNMLVVSDLPKDATDAYLNATRYAPELVEAWYNLGVCYRRTGKIEDSVKSFVKAVELQPANPMVYERFGILLYGLGRFAEAANVYRQWLVVEPDSSVARHMLAAMTGEDVPARADDQYLKDLFDRFSSSFDENLKGLGYRAPELLVSALGEYVPTDGRLDVLDAGCGTGLCGGLLRSMSRSLVGVDLSDGMVEKARARNIYDELVVAELCGFMRDRPNAFDVVISADTLVYFGALEEAALAARSCIRENGVFAFTLERHIDEPVADPQPGMAPAAGDPVRYRIQPHGRYVHHADYVRAALTAGGFTRVELKDVVLRRERGQDVQGHLVVAQ